MSKRSRLSNKPKKRLPKNLLKEYEDFVDEQMKLNPKSEWSKSWDGWGSLFIVKKTRGGK